jgi:hypothetical protein
VPSGVLGAGVLVGFVAVWFAYLIPYLSAGTAQVFVENYLLVPLAVSDGYSGSYWQSSSSWTAFFYLGPLVLLLIGLLLAVGLGYRAQSGQGSAVSRPTGSQSWIAAFGLFIAAAVALSSSLNRSDNSHLFNSGWIFPFAVVAFIVYALEMRREIPTFLRVAFVSPVIIWLVTLMFGTTSIFPFMPATNRLVSAIQGRIALWDWVPPNSMGRIDGPLDENAPALTGGPSVTRTEIEDFTSALKRELGEIPTYVDTSVGGTVGALTTGYWYFAADLKPVEIPYEEDAMVITETQRQANLVALRDRGTAICGLVTANPETDQARAVLERGGFALASQISLAGQPITVFRCES